MSLIAYYTLGEPAGATTAGDTSGNGAPVLTQAGSGADVVFGNATGPGTDSLTAATFAGGKWLKGGITPLGSAASVLIEAFFSTSTTAANQTIAAIKNNAGANVPGAEVIGIVVDQTTGVVRGGFGVAGVNIITGASAGSVADGNTHHAAWRVTLSGGNAVGSLWLDGVLVSSPSAAYVAPFPASIDTLHVGGGPDPGGTQHFTGTIAHVPVFVGTEVADARVVDHANAGLNGFNTDTSDQRISRYLTYGGVPTASQVLETGVQTNVPHYDITGNSVAGAVAKVNEGEVGVVFARGDGKVVFHNRQHRQLKTTADWTLTAIDLDPGTVVPADMQQVTNIATSSRAGGATQAAQSASSITKHGQYPASYDSLLVTTDAQALDRINWQVGTHAEPGARFNQLQIDLLTASQTLQQNAQARELGDRLSITGLPSQAPAGLADQIIEGWTETLTAASWDMTFNTSPWGLEQAWILGDATYGVLGSTTRLGF
jgi:hypothetical protein